MILFEIDDEPLLSEKDPQRDSSNDFSVNLSFRKCGKNLMINNQRDFQVLKWKSNEITTKKYLKFHVKRVQGMIPNFWFLIKEIWTINR